VIRLGVNIDHVATLRRQRRGGEPDVARAADEAVAAGADGITVHLREDRRHIQESDVIALAARHRLNLEMAATQAMTEFAVSAGSRRPHAACLVPERREELTTEGGLDVIANVSRIAGCVAELTRAGVVVSLFVEPDPWQLQAAARTGAEFVELHTGRYAEAFAKGLAAGSGAPERATEVISERTRLELAARTARGLGLRVNAGHGLDLENLDGVLGLEGLEELNIGFALVARAVFVGLREAVGEMKAAIDGGRKGASA
jgi:pyridoxine 5-phosphate synthase